MRSGSVGRPDEGRRVTEPDRAFRAQRSGPDMAVLRENPIRSDSRGILCRFLLDFIPRPDRSGSLGDRERHRVPCWDQGPAPGGITRNDWTLGHQSLGLPVEAIASAAPSEAQKVGDGGRRSQPPRTRGTEPCWWKREEPEGAMRS